MGSLLSSSSSSTNLTEHMAPPLLRLLKLKYPRYLSTRLVEEEGLTRLLTEVSAVLVYDAGGGGGFDEDAPAPRAHHAHHDLLLTVARR
jgi:hypothetical protein